MKKIFVLITLLNTLFYAQSSSTILFPSELNVEPFTANFLEPKIGFLFEQNKNELRLNIGNSLDFIHQRMNQNTVLSFGADFFTYSLLRSEKDFHFPVDAIDYLFGLNAGVKFKCDNYSYGARLRLSHISAHFVDGHYDWNKSIWRNGIEPKVYSREFLELIPFYEIKNYRFYAGLTYLYHIDPNDVGNIIYQAGFDKYFKNFISSNLHPFIAYDIRLLKLDKYSANNSLQAGVKYGRINSRGIKVYFEYFNGKNIHGEYFRLKENYSAIGVNFDI